MLRPYQIEGINSIRQAFQRHRRVLYQAPTGAGKCLARGTPVLMFDGTVRPVEKIALGQLLMGPDSLPRRVVSLATGQEAMFRIVPTKGEAFTVNESHILSLKMTTGNKLGYAAGEIVNLSVRDYLLKSKTFRHCAKLWRTGVDFEPSMRPLLLEPYFLGLWLGDGHSRHVAVTTGDPEIVTYLDDLAVRHGLRLHAQENSENSKNYYLAEEKSTRGVCGRGKKTNPILNALKSLHVYKNKHIPHQYLTAPRTDRLQLLAGIIDTDGYLGSGYYEVCIKSEPLAEGILFLARSLGLAAYRSTCSKACTNNGVVGTYQRISISGGIDQVPCRLPRKQAAPRQQIKNPMVTGFAVEPIGDGEYFGFEIDGPDRLFLLGDFTVTHNTRVFTWLAEQISSRRKRVLILAHRRELIRQACEKLAEAGVTDYGVIDAGGRKPVRTLVTVASVQTLVNRLAHYPDGTWDLIIVDEAHHAVATTYAKILKEHRSAHILGVTATPERLDGRGLRQEFDELVLGPAVRDLILDGYLADYVAYGAETRPDLSGIHMVAGDYDKGELAALMSSQKMVGDLVDHYRKYADGLPAVAFCVTVAHAEAVALRFQEAGYLAGSVDGSMDTATRDERIGGLANGQVQILTSCALIGEGLDIPGIVACIDCKPTLSLAQCMQQWGRALRPKADPDQKAVILDHAGNLGEHGFPDDPREWSLDATRRARKKKKQTIVQITTCFGCYASLPAGTKICPHCGEVLKVAEEPPEMAPGELVEMRPLWFDDDGNVTVSHARQDIEAAVAKCRSMKDLTNLAKALNFKPGWAYFQARSMNWIPIMGRSGRPVTYVRPKRPEAA